MARSSVRFSPIVLNDEVPVFVISLDDQVSRRQDLVRRGVPAPWVHAYFPAIDLRVARTQAVAELADLDAFEAALGRQILSSEIGCAKSHKAVADWLAASQYPMALVLEDDAIPIGDAWFEQLMAVAEALSAHANSGAAFICHLGAPHNQTDAALKRRVVWRDGQPPVGTPQLFLHADPGRSLWRAHAYLISRAAACRRLRQEPRIVTLADDWREKQRRREIDEIFYTWPILIGQDEERPSTIRLQKHTEVHGSHPVAGSFLGRIYRAVYGGNFTKQLYGSVLYRAAMAVACFRARLAYPVSMALRANTGDITGECLGRNVQ